nr:hypothetical protein [Lacticaseibacillus paracasei]
MKSWVTYHVLKDYHITSMLVADTVDLLPDFAVDCTVGGQYGKEGAAEIMGAIGNRV